MISSKTTHVPFLLAQTNLSSHFYFITNSPPSPPLYWRKEGVIHRYAVHYVSILRILNKKLPLRVETIKNHK